MDIEVRNVLKGGVSNGRLKCAVGNNYCRLREQTINNDKDSQCLRCIDIES